MYFQFYLNIIPLLVVRFFLFPRILGIINMILRISSMIITMTDPRSCPRVLDDTNSLQRIV